MKNKVASVMLINNRKEFLFCLRDNKPEIPYPNKWALIGGHLENDEKPLDALKREIKEEIEMEFYDNFEFIGKIEDDGANNEVFIYKNKINQEIKEINLTEGQKLGFFNFNEILTLDTPKPLNDFLQKYKEKILNT